MLVYVTHTGTRDITRRMDDILTRHGFKVAVMKPRSRSRRCSPGRSAWPRSRSSPKAGAAIPSPKPCPCSIGRSGYGSPDRMTIRIGLLTAPVLCHP